MGNKLQILKVLLIAGALYYFIGAIVHLFGLTVFPFYDGVLYQPYHDTVIALSAITLGLLLYVIARDPKKNIDALNIIIVSGIIAIIFSIGIIININFDQLGAHLKRTQTIVEAVLLVCYVFVLNYFKPKK